MSLNNYFAGFKKFEAYQSGQSKEQPTWTAITTKRYLGQNFYWNGQKSQVSQSFNANLPNGKKVFIQAGVDIGINKDFAKKLKGEPDGNTLVPVQIGNIPDPKIPTQSDDGVGQPSEAGGMEVWMPYKTFAWAIQPGNPNQPAGAAGSMGGMGSPMGGGLGGGLGGMMGGGMGAPAPKIAGPASGGAPMAA